MNHIIHALEHEFVEIECRKLTPFTKKIRKGFDNLSFDWHRFDFPHECSEVGGIVYG